MDKKGISDKISKTAGEISAVASVVSQKTKEVAKGATSKTQEFTENVGIIAKDTSEKTKVAAKELAVKSKDTLVKSKQVVFDAVDQNGDGEIGIEDVIIMGLKVPGIGIDREDFLKKQFFKNHPEEQIRDAIQNTPAHAKIAPTEIDKIANEVIKEERYKVSGISAALSAPGGVAMVATVPADIAQYYGYMLRAAQELMYLYGFPQIDLEEKGRKFDSETLNVLTICMGVMYGAAGANAAIKSLANALAKGVEKQLLKKALTKGAIYPMVKSISKWFGLHMTKQVFAGAFKTAIPIIGGVIGGGLTFATFKPCCDKLKVSLEDTMLSNPEGHIVTEDEVLI